MRIELFNIPIYLNNQVEFEKKLKAKFHKRVTYYINPMSLERAIETAQMELVEYNTWKFNQQVGQLNIYVEKGEFYFDVYLPKQTKFDSFSRRKNFVQLRLYLNNHFSSRHMSSIEISNEINKFIGILYKELFLKYYFDFKAFNNLNSYIDYSSLVKNSY